MIKSIIFDFDGVILESAEIKTEAFRRLFEKQFPQSIDQIVEYHKKNMGISRFVKFRQVYKEFADKRLAPQEEALLGEEFSKIIFDRVLQTPMVAGALEFLNQNHQKYALFVASGTPKEELIDIMQKRNLLYYFKEVFGSPEGKADIIKNIMRKYQFHASEIVFVGDAESDYTAASSTQVHFIAKISLPSHLKHCIYQITDMNEITQILNQLNRGLYVNERG